MKFLEKWDRQLGRLGEDRFYFVLLGAMATLVAALVTVLALSLQYNFWTIACDTAAVQNAIVNTMHGSWFRDTAYDGPNLLGLHTMLALLLVMPVYALIPSPNTLFVLQVLGVYSTVIPLYLVAQEMLRRPLVAFLVAGLALASPLLLNMAVAPFHPETWIGAAVLWSWFFYLKNRSIGFWTSFGFAVSCGEQAALIYVALGAALLLVDDGVAWRKRYGMFALAGGFAWLIFAFGLLSPLMRHPGQHNLFAYNYSDWGINSAPGLLSAVGHDPFRAISLLIDPIHWLYVASLVGVPLLLAFLSPRCLLLLVPSPVYFFMSNQEFFLYFHAYYYQFAFFAGYLGLIYFLSRWDITTRLGTVVLAAAALINVLVLCDAAGFYLQDGSPLEPGSARALHEAFAQIPPDAAVYSPHRYSAYLSNRENMVMGDLRDENLDFNKMLEAKFDTTDVHPEQIDYIVCDLQGDQCGPRFVQFNPNASKNRAANVGRLIKSGQWEVFWHQDDVVILRRVEK